MNEEEKVNEEIENKAVENEANVESTPQVETPADVVSAEPEHENAKVAEQENAKEESKPERVNLRIELKKMIEFVAKYPEIGPTVSKIASKVGEESTARRISAMGTESGQLRAEYYAVASHSARHQRNYDEALKLVREGIDSLETPLPKDDYGRFVKMVKTGFAVLLFNKDRLDAAPAFTDGLAQALDRFAESFGEDADFLSLYAQALWLTDIDAAEKVWDRATTAPKNESSWNARGTWYKEVAKDLSKAADAYRKGLEKNKASALLGHNLAQVLIDLAKEDEEKQGSLYAEADRLLRDALRNSKRRGYRRHIHETLDRLKTDRPKRQKKVKAKPTTPPPSVGDKIKATVASIANFGAFLEIEGNHRGLLHCSNIAHEHVHDPADYVKVGEEIEVEVIEVQEQKNGSFRIGFSRKSLIEGSSSDKPNNTNNRRNSNNKKPNNRDSAPRRNKKGGSKRDNARHKEESGATLGELLMAKLNEKK